MPSAAADHATEQTWKHLLDALVVDADAIVERVFIQISTLLDSYRTLPREMLFPTLRANTTRVLLGVRDHLPPPDDDAQFRAAGAERARQGVRAADMLQTWRIGSKEMIATAREVLADDPQRDLLLLRLLEATLEWIDRGMLLSAIGHQEATLELSSQEFHERENLVRRVLFGGAPTHDIGSRLEMFQVDPRAEYVAVRSRPLDATESSRVGQWLLPWDSAARRHGLLAMIDGDLCGFVADVPADPPPGQTELVIGVSAPTRLAGLGAAFAQATRALETCLALGISGARSLGSLGVLPAVVADSDVGDSLVARYVEPVLADSPSGRTILETVETYLTLDARVDATAESLHLHKNTLRYRLGRFEQFTGCSLRDHTTRIEVWWALQRWRLPPG